MITMPAFNSIQLPQYMHTETLAPYKGTEFTPDGFMLQCQFYFESYADPKAVVSSSCPGSLTEHNRSKT